MWWLDDEESSFIFFLCGLKRSTVQMEWLHSIGFLDGAPQQVQAFSDRTPRVTQQVAGEVIYCVLPSQKANSTEYQLLEYEWKEYFCILLLLRHTVAYQLILHVVLPYKDENVLCLLQRRRCSSGNRSSSRGGGIVLFGCGRRCQHNDLFIAIK